MKQFHFFVLMSLTHLDTAMTTAVIELERGKQPSSERRSDYHSCVPGFLFVCVETVLMDGFKKIFFSLTHTKKSVVSLDAVVLPPLSLLFLPPSFAVDFFCIFSRSLRYLSGQLSENSICELCVISVASMSTSTPFLDDRNHYCFIVTFFDVVH